MDDNQVSFPAHPQGELQERDEDHDLIERGKALETFGGKVFVRWDAEAAVTALAAGACIQARPASPAGSRQRALCLTFRRLYQLAELL